MEKLELARAKLLHHSIYQQMTSPERIRVFMKHHVFAVWDFMSLLKKLQQTLTCVSVPWLPNQHSEYARFINEIVLGEETDRDQKGNYSSHFELYVGAMEEVQADTQPIEQFLQMIQLGNDPIMSLMQNNIPSTVTQFVKNSLTIALHGNPHEVAASFFFGREDLIPDMFSVLLKELESNETSESTLQYYLQRHIELDGDEHGPLAEKLLSFLCEGNPTKQKEAEETAIHSLESRILLWDGVLQEIEEKSL